MGRLRSEPHNSDVGRRDLDLMVQVVALAREVGAAPQLADWRKREAFPGPGVTDQKGLGHFARRAANSFHHPVGSSRMGSDDGAVVDLALRVRAASRVFGWSTRR
jgi:choline dehydrogenase-like flavoprotein